MIIFLVPAYNEEENIGLLIQRIQEKMNDLGYQYRMIIVDDGSTDGTKAVVQHAAVEAPIELLSYFPNRGVGEAFRVGFRHAVRLARDGDIIISKEADNTSDLGILDLMLSKIEDGYDLVLASCYAETGKVVGTTWDRVILSSGANLLCKWLLPVKGIHTFSSFYRAHKAELLRLSYQVYGDALIEESGFACMVEMLVKMAYLNPKIGEVPMVLRADLRSGTSKMKRWKTTRAYLRLFTKHLLSRCWHGISSAIPLRGGRHD